MHTTGEPTRIVVQGYPPLTENTTLLEQRAEAKQSHDHIRRRLLLEPRGHFDMYGAILRPNTELTRSGQADMGVLFLTNEGYSTMCGHATIALGRFLLDTHDTSVFPRRAEIKHDPTTKTATLNLHAPCGLVKVTVPTNDDGSRSDPSRPVTFISIPSFATGIKVEVPISTGYSWPQLKGRTAIIADFSYGGAFFCIVPATELGFPNGLHRVIDYAAMSHATKQLKAAVNDNAKLRHLFHHPDHDDLGFLYSIMVVDDTLGVSSDATESSGAETGLCYFADQAIDRSPTGSGVTARVALAYAKGAMRMGESRTYHSLVSNDWKGRGAFLGTVAEELPGVSGSKSAPSEQQHQKLQFPIVRVRVGGYASYTGFATYVVEGDDPLQDDGFIFEWLGS